jgi:hypothetical protein
MYILNSMGGQYILDGGTLILVKRFDVLTVVKVFMLVF